MPKRGDLEVRRLSDKKPMYIMAETLSKPDIDTTVYEIIGPILERRGDKVLVAYKSNVAKKWCNRIWWYLSGYTLDGTARSGVLVCYFAHDKYQTATEKTIAYTASSESELVSILNAAFAADSDFSAIDYSADLQSDGRIRITCQCNHVLQLFGNSAKSGFVLTGVLPEITALANMRCKHGGVSGNGAISSWYRALAYYRNDNGKPVHAGGRTTEQTSVKQLYPINLPTWLGTSTKNPGDFCAALRAVYGEGEEGWLKFMKSCLPIVDTDYGNMGQAFGREMTAKLASFRYGDNAPCCTAADYCYSIESTTIDRGEFFLGAPRDIAAMLDDIQYGTNDSRTADIVNATLYKIGGSAISNRSAYWSCSRSNSGRAWYAYNYCGYFSGGAGLTSGFVCVPLSLHTA